MYIQKIKEDFYKNNSWMEIKHIDVDSIWKGIEAGLAEVDSEGQVEAVVIPKIVEDEYDKKHHELLLAVGKKYLGETRHETALRYIKEAEDNPHIGDEDKGNILRFNVIAIIRND